MVRYERWGAVDVDGLLREFPLEDASVGDEAEIGVEDWVEALEQDADLRRVFFQDLRLMLYGGAGLPQPLFDRLQALAKALKVITSGTTPCCCIASKSSKDCSGCLPSFCIDDDVERSALLLHCLE